MAHVAMGAYARGGDYERITGGGYSSREAQGNTSFYREGNNSQLEYLNFARASEGNRVAGDGVVPESGYFPTIAGVIGQVPDRLGALQLTEQQGGLGRPSSPSENLLQAIKAVEVAETAIIEQMQENEHLRTELKFTNWELQNYKQEPASSRQPEENSFQASQKAGMHSPPKKNGVEDYGAVPSLNGQRSPSNGSQPDFQRTLVVHQGLLPEYSSQATPPPAGLSTSRNNPASNVLNSNPRGLNQGVTTGQAAADYSTFSQISSPSSRSVSPNRYHREGDLDSRAPLSGQGLLRSPEITSQSNLWKQQDWFLRGRAQEEEILQLRKRLADNAIKELKLHNEKHVLEKRIATMRMAFDQQQQDLVDAASKALSYRHDIMEENIRLTYELQAAEQERSAFVSALLPLLAEYDFQPAVTDAHSIVSNVKVLIQHLHEKLNLSEAKLKDSQYHLTAWRADPAYQSPYAPQSPFHPNSDHSNPTPNTHGLEIVPQPAYAKGRMPASPPPRGYNGGDWDPSAGKYQHAGISSDLYHGTAHDHLRQPPYSHSSNETYEHQAHAVSPAPAPNDLRSVLPSDEEPSMHVPMNDPFSDSEYEDTPGSGAMKEKDHTQREGRSPHLPTLQEEPNSSNSEEDDPLPAIENLQIVGEAVPGSMLQACGFSINGTTLCVFQWVRHLQDGTMVYIEGAAQPDYTVTADDVDALIAIECVPMDDRNRKFFAGELVKVFANDQNKIICESTMQDQIESYFFAGQAVFDVQLAVGTLDIWEPAVLTLKRSNYEIKGNRQRRVAVSEKYTSELNIVIPYGHQAQFVLTSSGGVSIALSSSEDNSKMRDTIVLTMRLFKKQALEKRKGKKKFIFLPK